MGANLINALILARGHRPSTPGDWKLFGGIMAVMLGFWAFRYWRLVVRSRRLRKLAPSLGFLFTANEPSLIDELARFALFSLGRSKRATNVLSGQAEDTDLVIFDYQYTRGGGKHASTHRQTVLLMRRADWDIPGFQLQPETFLRKIENLLGYDDVNLADQPEFSRKFNLKGENDALLRQFFTPGLIEFFETQPKISAEGTGSQLLIYRSDTLVAVDEVGSLVETGWQLRAALPPPAQSTDNEESI